MPLPSSATMPNYPAFVDAREYDAEFLRMIVQALWGNKEGILSTNVAPFIDKLDGVDSGSGIPGDLAVTTAGAGLQVNVASGRAIVRGDTRSTQGSYFCFVDVTKTVAMPAAHATLPRVDAVILKVEDSDVLGASDRWSVTFQQGTATAGASLTNLTGAPGQGGGPTLNDSSLILTYVLTPAAFAGPYVNATHLREARTLLVRPGTLMYHAKITADGPAPTVAEQKVTNLEVNNVLPPAGGRFDCEAYVYFMLTGAGASANGMLHNIRESTGVSGPYVSRALVTLGASQFFTLNPRMASYAPTTTGPAGGKTDFCATMNVPNAAGTPRYEASDSPAFLAIRAAV